MTHFQGHVAFIAFGSLCILCIVLFNIIYVKGKGFYQYATRHVLAYSLLVVFLCLFIFFFSGYKRLQEAETIIDFIIEILSNYVSLFAVALVYFIERSIKNRYEDKEKLSDDYVALAEKYGQDNLIADESVVYPVVLLGQGNLCVYSSTEEEME